MSAAHGSWKAELTTFETHTKAWLVALFGLPPAAVLVALESAGVTLPTWATALLALLPILGAVSGVVWGPANKTALDTSYGTTLTSEPEPLEKLGAMIKTLKQDIDAAQRQQQHPPLPPGMAADQIPDPPAAVPPTT